jgi:hypothetical protein
VGVARSKLYTAMDRDPVFKEGVSEARNFADEIVVKRLYDKCREGDTKAIIFWLKNRKRHEWRDRHEVDVSTDRDIATLLRAARERVRNLRGGNGEQAIIDITVGSGNGESTLGLPGPGDDPPAEDPGPDRGGSEEPGED